MKLPWRRLPIASLLFCHLACTSLGQTEVQSAVVVTEKSKVKEPQWIQIGAASLEVDEYELSAASLKSDILNLPVGIRDAQKEAKEAHYDLLYQYVLNEVDALAKNHALTGIVDEKIQKDVSLALERNYDDHFKVKDIYYEKTLDHSQRPTVESYRVYTLIIYPKQALSPIYEDLARQWSRDKDPRVKKLAKFIKP